MKTLTMDQDQRANASKIGYVVMGFFYAIAIYQVPASIVAFVTNSTDVANLMRFSIPIQFIVGFAISLVAYNVVSNHSLRFGMRIFYGLVVGSLFIIGGYSILTSLMSA